MADARKRINAIADDIIDVTMSYNAPNQWSGCDTCGYGQDDGYYDVFVLELESR